MNQKRAALLLLTLTLITVASAAALILQKRIPSGGRIKKIGIECYWDAENTQVVSSVDWGVLEPGQNRTVSFYVRNLGNVQVSLSMWLENWTPVGADAYITVTWDAEGAVLAPDAQSLVALTLTVSPSVTGFTDFTVDIVIQGSG